MGAWLREKLVELGLNLILVGLFLGLLFGWSPAWLEHPGAGLAWLLDYAAWLVVPVMAWAALRRRFGDVGPLVVRSFWDAEGWPVVTWSEPRFDSKAILFKARRVTARCYTREADGLRLFCYQAATVHDVRSDTDCISVPLASIAGFAVTTAAQLYRTSDQRELSDGGHIVLRAEFDPPLPGGQAFIPLTLTAAARGEVEALHRVLSLVFAPGGLAARVASQASAPRGMGAPTASHAAQRADGAIPEVL